MARSELGNELRRLRRGRGLQAPRIDNEIGPALRRLCGVTPSDNQAVIREKVKGKLGRLSASLPLDLRPVLIAALALDVDMAGKFLGNRVELLGRRYQRDVRTIRRWIDEAIDLVEEAAESSLLDTSGGTWRLERFEALLLLDAVNPQVIERRTIVAQCDLGDRIHCVVTPPPHRPAADRSPEIQATHIYGAEIVDHSQHTDGRIVLDLKLPTPLSAGQKHEYGVIVRAANALARHDYLYYPDRQCEAFDLRIRFGPAEPPPVVRIVRGLRADDPPTECETAPMSVLHEVHAKFANLESGCAYGARWWQQSSA
ncbi:hypothetical protein ACFQV2_03560 [Actinokineospora soli]|uniref:Uncharacterized protein n=1 Tax=Actinokineospora soli TaxID=1048753 RepID=A0ABW2TI94_9PSEU